MGKAGPSNSNLAEAVHYLSKWSKAMGFRWKELHTKVSGEGFTVNEILKMEEKKFTVVVNPGVQNQEPGVFVALGGYEDRVERIVLAVLFDVKLLPEIRKAVFDSIEHVERRYKEKLEELPKLIDEFGADVADMKKDGTFARFAGSSGT